MLEEVLKPGSAISADVIEESLEDVGCARIIVQSSVPTRGLVIEVNVLGAWGQFYLITRSL